jgi:hypothetical protein
VIGVTLPSLSLSFEELFAIPRVRTVFIVLMKLVEDCSFLFCSISSRDFIFR